ncbi:cytochrome b562 [Enterobacter roggenkampii]|uniref:cytochrome b562 n=1 Tax=Enterobacter roggenkampii TaxID=1812935 RepID=UPI00222E8872|nr:cytochrome b562 [Enterobacter roggenkampii]
MLLFFEKIGKGLFFCAILPLLTVKTRVNNIEAIMRKIMRTVVIGATLLLSPCVMAGSDGVEHAMKMMNKSYRAALKEEDVTSFRKDMRELKATAESILNSPVEGYDRETYVAGMSLLIDEVTAVESTAEKEGLDAGKIAAQKLNSCA